MPGIIKLNRMRRRDFTRVLGWPLLVRARGQAAASAVEVVVEGIEGEERVPVVNVQVLLLRRRPSMNVQWPLPVYSEFTQRDGRARFSEVTPGLYTAYVQPEPRGPEEAHWMPAHLGGSPSWRTAEMFRVGPQPSELQFKLLLKKGEALPLEGSVEDEAGRPVAGANVTLFRDDLPFLQLKETTSAAHGKFAFARVWPDAYRIRAQFKGAPGTPAAEERIDLPVQGAAPVRLRLDPPFDLEGRVEGEEMLAALEKSKPFRLHLFPVTGSVYDERNAEPQAGGAFRFANVAPGRYRLEAGPLPAGFYLDRIQLAGVDATGEEVDLRRGYGPVAVKIEAGPGALSGKVEDAGGSAVVVLLSTDAKRRGRYPFIPTAQTGEAGAFQLGNLRPGEYYAWAFDKVEKPQLEDELLIERLKPSAELVKIVRSQTSSVVLKLSDWELAAGS